MNEGRGRRKEVEGKEIEERRWNGREVERNEGKGRGRKKEREWREKRGEEEKVNS